MINLRSLLIAALVVSAFCTSCHSDSDEEKVSGDGETRTSQSSDEAARREKVARERFQRASVMRVDKKFEAMSEVAQVYGDTEAGAEALLQLVHVGLDSKPPAFTATWREIDFFGRAQPGSAAYAGAVSIFSSVIDHDVRWQLVPEAERAALVPLRKKARAQRLRLAREKSATAEGSKDHDLLRELGEAELVHGNLDRADAAWAKVEDLGDETPISIRMTTLSNRAEMWATKGKDPARARKLYSQAKELLTEVQDARNRADLGRYLEERLAALDG